MSEAREELRKMVNSLRQSVSRRGLRTVPGRVVKSPAPPEQDKAVPSPPLFPANKTEPPAVAGPLAGFIDDTSLTKAERLAKLREHIGDCQRCPLGSTRIQLAFGVGNPDARVLFVGEGPGYAEDRQGEPFVGPAGQLLDKILVATDLSRTKVSPAWKWVYIANMVKCHPMVDPSDNTKRSNDRPPTPEEMAVCSPFLMAQIRIIRPAFIVTLGGTAGKALLQTEEGISTFRGKWFDFKLPNGDETFRLLPTYHPAALLRNSRLKLPVWEDMKNLKAALESAPLPKPR